MNKDVKYFKTFKELRAYRKGITEEIKPIEVKEEKPKKASKPKREKVAKEEENK